MNFPYSFQLAEDESLYAGEPHAVIEHFLDRSNDLISGNFPGPRSVQQNVASTLYNFQGRPNQTPAALRTFQQNEQAQFSTLRQRYPGSSPAAFGPSYEQPTYAPQPSFTAYGAQDWNQHRLAGGNGMTSAQGYGMLGYEGYSTVSPLSWSQGSINSVPSSMAGGYHPSYPSQPYRQQSNTGQSSAYTGAYVAGYQQSPYLPSGQQSNPSQSSTYTGAYVDDYQQSPYLPFGQQTQYANNSPYAPQSRYPTPHGPQALPPSQQGLSGFGVAGDTQARSTSTHASGIHAARPLLKSFAEPEKRFLPAVSSGSHPVPQPRHTCSNWTKPSATSVESSDEEEDSKEGPGVRVSKRKSGVRTRRCATLRKILHEHGTTQVVNGQLMWSDPNEPEDRKWKPAVIMDDIRKHILRQQNQVATASGGDYDNPDEPGSEPYGDTAFFLPHRHLGEGRDARAAIVFMIYEPENHPQPQYDPGWMMYDPVSEEISDEGTVIVLNPADNPIVNWKEIPLCLSPHVDPSKIEFMKRTNKAIRHQDLWARMPRQYWQTSGDSTTLRQLSSANTMINMRLQRFRQRTGCLSWTDHKGSDGIEVGLKTLLNQSAKGQQCLAANSMQPYGRDLNVVEQLQIKRVNADGKYLKNAGSRAVSEKTRQERRVKEDNRIANAQKAENRSMSATPTPPQPAVTSSSKVILGGAESRKRVHSDEEEDFDVPEQGTLILQRPGKRLRTMEQGYSGATENDLAMFDRSQYIIGDSHPPHPYPPTRPTTSEAYQSEYQEHGRIPVEASYEKGEEDVTQAMSRKDKGRSDIQRNYAQIQSGPQRKPPHGHGENLDSPNQQYHGQAKAASSHKRRRVAGGEASRPIVILDDDQDLPSTELMPEFVLGESNTTTLVPNPLPYQGDHDNRNDFLLEGQHQNDDDYETRNQRRPIHPLPNKSARQEAEEFNPFDTIDTQEQDLEVQGTDGIQIYITDDGSVADPADITNSGEPQAPVEDEAKEDVEKEKERENEKEENITPPVSQETDLERHRRLTREFLGEENVFYYLPGLKPPCRLQVPLPSNDMDVAAVGEQDTTDGGYQEDEVASQPPLASRLDDLLLPVSEWLRSGGE